MKKKNLKPEIKAELWKRGILSWKQHTGQRIIYKALRALGSDVREPVILCSRRWGKSYLGVLMAIEDCLAAPGRQVFIVGPSLKQTRRIITPLIQEVTKDAPKGLVKQTKSELTWAIGESTLIIGAFDTALESFRGLRADAIYLEESGLANPEDYDYILKSVLRPTLMHSRGKMYHLTTPPREGEAHPFVSNTLPMATLNKCLYTFTIEDNPLLSKEDIEAEIDSVGGRGSEHCERELFCRILGSDRRIIPEFNEAIHVKEIQPPAYTFFLTSIDFGGVRDNHAILLTYFDFENNRFHILDERWLEVNTGTTDIIAAGREMEAANKVVWLKGTPKRITDAPGQTQVDIKRLGYECTPPEKGKDSVEDGIQALRVAFLKEAILIHPRCVHLIQTLKFGLWDRLRKDFLRTDALGHCDMIAALSYAYRHIDRHNNPFPPNLGKHRDYHYNASGERRTDNEDVLAETFFGD